MQATARDTTNEITVKRQRHLFVVGRVALQQNAWKFSSASEMKATPLVWVRRVMLPPLCLLFSCRCSGGTTTAHGPVSANDGHITLIKYDVRATIMCARSNRFVMHACRCSSAERLDECCRLLSIDWPRRGDRRRRRSSHMDSRLRSSAGCCS